MPGYNVEATVEYFAVLTVNVAEGQSTYGSVSGSDVVVKGTEVQISATPATDYHFVQWQDDNSNNPRTITVTEDATYTATFAINQYRLDSIPTSWRVAIGEGTPFSPTAYGDEHPDSGYVMIPLGAEFLIIPSDEQKPLIKNLELIDKMAGTINGKFTINSSGDQVYFSQGNLQYTKSTSTWSFMEHQWSTVETLEQYVGPDYANQDVVSIFGWGTSGVGCITPVGLARLVVKVV